MRVWVDASTLSAVESIGEGPRPPRHPGADRGHASDWGRGLHGARIPTPAGGPGVVDRGRPRPGRPEAVDRPRLGDWRGILVRDAEGRPPYPRRDPGTDRRRGGRSSLHRPPRPPIGRGRGPRDPRLPRAGDPGEAGPKLVPDERRLVRGGPPPAGGPGLSRLGRYPGRPQPDVRARIVLGLLCVPGRRDQARSAGENE